MKKRPSFGYLFLQFVLFLYSVIMKKKLFVYGVFKLIFKRGFCLIFLFIFNIYCLILQNGLSMGESFVTEATKLFNDSKHLLLSNNSTIGVITVTPVICSLCFAYRKFVWLPKFYMKMHTMNWFWVLDQQEGVERYWFVFVLYSVKRLSEKEVGNSSNGNEGNAFSLCQILRGAKLKWVFFFLLIFNILFVFM